MVATISDGTNSVNSSTTVKVETADLNHDGNTSPMDVDSDGDGFSDNIEKAFGSDPRNASSIPAGYKPRPVTPVTPGTSDTPDPALPTFIQYKVQKGATLKTKGNLDTLELSGILHVTAGLKLDGQQIVVDAGGNTVLFTLNAQGTGKVGTSTLTLKGGASKRDREAPFSLSLKGSLMENILKNSTLDAKGRPTIFSANIYFDGQLLNGTVELKYKK